MSPFTGMLRLDLPKVFNPKVTPDPTESERLEAKLIEATRRLNERFGRAAERRRRMVLQA